MRSLDGLALVKIDQSSHLVKFLLNEILLIGSVRAVRDRLNYMKLIT